MTMHTSSLSSDKVFLSDAFREGQATQSFANALCWPNQRRRQEWQIYPLMRSKFQPTWMSSMVRIESNLESPTYNTQLTIII